MRHLRTFESTILPEIDENTIRVEIKERKCYIDFYFKETDTEYNLTYVDNKWDIKTPNWSWTTFNNPLYIIKIWAERYDKRSETYYILKKDTDKYNL